MKASEIIRDLAKLIANHGDMNVKVSLLSDRGDCDIEPINISSWYEKTDARHITIDCEVDDANYLYTNLK